LDPFRKFLHELLRGSKVAFLGVTQLSSFLRTRAAADYVRQLKLNQIENKDEKKKFEEVKK